MPDLYACLCTDHFPAQAMLRLRSSLAATAVAILEGQRPWQHICSYNHAAALLGVTIGISRSEAEIFPITLLQRSHLEEEATRSALLAAASQFTPLIEDRSTETECLLLLQLKGTERLFGPPQAVAKRLVNYLGELGLTVRISIAANFHAALCLARAAANTTEDVFQIPHGSERTALAALPLSSLNLTPEQADTFACWGLKTLHDLATLKVDDVVARLGQAGRSLWQLARGEHPHHFVPIPIPFSLVESIQFDHPIDILESLLFALSPMLEQLILRAQNNALALASITVHLTLEAAPPHQRTVRSVIPTSNRTLLLKLLQLDLESHPPPAAVLALTLTAEPGPTGKYQLGLFSPQLPEPMQLEVTLARIAAIVGEANIGSARLSDTHQPAAFTMEKFSLLSASRKIAESSPVRTGSIALRRLRPPVSVNVTLVDGWPRQFFFNQVLYRIEQAFGPWQTSGNWWVAEPWSMRCWDVIARVATNPIQSESFKESMLTGTISESLLDHRWHLESLYD